ncbi:GNAT family N-acetyltransferase [Parenemella sanctibonifatiensis]|uniref:GNAT family N-acetyltransferase n=1 Tax=Parenemella sanctibonifatiensis TaxID=2016505 RepID=A0A255EIR3_9ACTN|nr:GNAT family N-acetyltransferase [Parenemella sanctibonifatiensis]OYN91394.1 GNAT family N-acetyltransferase [Parenemella sanctibonifatiensis]
MTEPSSFADSVRLALPAEAPALAGLQRRVWRTDLPEELSAELLAQGEGAMTAAWQSAIHAPPEARFRVLVAVADGTAETAGRTIVGFAAVGPAADPGSDPATTGLIGEFLIDPDARRQGHGSRLLNACIDTLRADGCTLAQWWLSSTDDVTRAFAVAAGWAADGAHREIGSEDGARLKQVRLHTSLAKD